MSLKTCLVLANSIIMAPFSNDMECTLKSARFENCPLVPYMLADQVDVYELMFWRGALSSPTMLFSPVTST
jgi:hypothetical protein